MPTTVYTTLDAIRTYNTARVYWSYELQDSLFGGLANWGLPEEHVEVVSLRLVAAPDIDQCTLRYRYGWFADGVRAPLPWLRRYVKVELIDENVDVTAPGYTTGDEIALTWYGIVEVDEQSAHGTVTHIDIEEENPDLRETQEPSGDQTLTAYGLLYELTRTPIKSAFIRTEDAKIQEIPRGLTFNAGDADTTAAFSQRGNQSPVNAIPGDIPTNPNYAGKVYSFNPHGQSVWTGSQIVDYLLEFHTPRAGFVQSGVQGFQMARWELAGQASALDWYDITVSTEGRTTKDVLDEVINRRRLVGYWVQGFEDTANNEFVVQVLVFTFTEANIPMPGGGTLPANPRDFELRFETSLDVQQALVRNSTLHAADYVTARGAWITSTFTPPLVEGWTQAQQTEWLDGAKHGMSAGELAAFAALSDEEQLRFHMTARGRDDLRDVFAKFVLPDDWDRTVPNPFYPPDPNQPAVVTGFLLGASTSTVAVALPGSTTGSRRARVKGKRFLPFLPVLDGAGDDYLPPFVVFRTHRESEIESYPQAGDTWEFGEQLNTLAQSGGEQSRAFSTHLEVLDTELGVRVIVGMSGGQPLITGEFEVASLVAGREIAEEHDPRVADNHAVDYHDSGMLCTLAWEWDERVSMTVGASPGAGVHHRELFIDVPDARLDIRLPTTVIGIDPKTGELVQDTDGTWLRDDRNRLEQIATAAYAWYGTQRQALTLKLQQLFDLFLPGDLLTNVGDSYTVPDVNTPVTGVVLDFDKGTTTIETSYADLDLA